MNFLDELYHHGIKGQKWGIRRYRNEDGSLTVAGKQRERLRRNVKRNRPYTDDINDIVKTLSKKERDFLGAEDNEEWIDKKHGFVEDTEPHDHSDKYVYLYRR